MKTEEKAPFDKTNVIPEVERILDGLVADILGFFQPVENVVFIISWIFLIENILLR